MDVSQVRAFLAVADELHFGRAAARLHIAQPPLSRTIKRLERELGVVLFERTTRYVELTACGRALLHPATEVLSALRRAERAAKSLQSCAGGVVRIAFAGISTDQLLGKVVGAVHARHPAVGLELYSQNFALPALKKVSEQDVDLALGRWDTWPEGLSVEVAMLDDLALAVPLNHPRVGANSVSFGDLGAERFVTLPNYDGSVVAERLSRLCLDNGFHPNIVQVAPDTPTALALVGAGVGCHLTFRSVAKKSNSAHIVFLQVVDRVPSVHLKMAWRDLGAYSPLDLVLGEVRKLGGFLEH